MSKIINLQLLQLENWLELKLENKAHGHYAKYGLVYKIVKVNTESITVIAKQVKLVDEESLEAARIIELGKLFFRSVICRGVVTNIHPHIYKPETLIK